MSDFNYSFELHEFEEALTPYGTIETRPPDMSTITIDDFTDGDHFRTGPDENGSLQLELEDRLLTIIVDESGSMTWNDNNGDRYRFYKRLLNKLNDTYPGAINANLIGFGGVPTKTTLFLAQAGSDFLTSTGQNFDQFLQETFQDSVFDFAGVRVVRRTDRFPNHPADGVVVAEGIVEAVKDENLTEGQDYYYGVWTFNKDLHFSQGQFIKGFPTDRVLPSGVNLATATPRILPGVERDVNTTLIYNFVEGGGFLIFDSSGSGYHGVVGSEVIEDNFWAGDAASSSHEQGGSLKKSVGVRFDGEFDIVQTDVSDITDITPTSLHDITVNLWMYRYDNNNQQQFVIGTSPDNSTDEIGWAIGIMENGTVGFATQNLSGGFTPISSDIVPLKEWTMITVKITNLVLTTSYINGVSQIGIFPTFTSPTDSTKLNIGAKELESGSSFTGSDFFGSLNLISIHDTDRDDTYISDLYDKELDVFEQPATQSSQNPPDNRQREVLLTWDIAEDFDFSGGEVKVVRKYNNLPSHIEDGDLVIQQNAEAGQFFYMDTFEFINSGNYYYRIFTTNSLGNICDRSEARVLSVRIPRSINEPASPVLEAISNETISEGSHKLYLQWSNPVDSRWQGTRIYFGTEGFPTINVNQNGSIDVSDGTLILDTTKSSFVHRIYTISETGARTPLTNGITHYYTIVTYDKFNRISEARYLLGVPSSQLDTVFPPEEVEDIHIEVLNPETLSVQWINPTVKSEQLDLFFGESSLIFVSVRDIFGGNLDDITNLKLQVCTSFTTRGLKTSETELGVGSGDPGVGIGGVTGSGGTFGSSFNEDCNSEEEEEETVLTFANIESGLIKGLLTHTNDRQTLSRRLKYTMDVRAQYQVVDPDDTSDDPEILFEFNTGVVRTTFTHPIEMSIVNKLRKFVEISASQDGGYRGETSPCECPSEQGEGNNQVTSYNGGYARSTQPYVARVEIQYKGESLPDGTPIRVELFKHGANEGNNNPLSVKSDRTFIREGIYITRAVLIEELGGDGEPTGRLISKSIVDVEIPHPQLSDFVDLYVTLNYLGFFIDGIHEVRFVDTLFIEVDVTKPSADGIDTAEQFVTAWSVNPDDPNNPDANIPVADGTVIKWELIKLAFAKERPFYSTEELPQILSGVYSSTTNGVARNVFFGPVGNVEAHHSSKTCGDEGGVSAPEPCCVGEQYAIKANVIIEDQSATDAYKFFYPCPFEAEFTNKRFLMNADPSQPFSGGPSQSPHWITWGDGVHMLKFQIAKTPAISNILGAECFRICVESEVGGQLFQFPDQHIVQISAPAEILWNVVFDEDPYTGTKTIASYDSISPKIAEELGIPLIANIPIIAETTDFYVRLNTFVGDANPSPKECESGQGGGGFGGDSDILPCEWRGICQSASGCSPTEGKKWNNVQSVSGISTLIAQNREITLLGGGDYENGIPPIYIGFREPLSVRVIDARINGARVDELVVDGVSQHTFTVEVTFANEPVPDGTPIELLVSGEDQDIVLLSSCINRPQGCQPGSSGVIYTRQVNDPIINPQNDDGTVAKRSLAYFSIDPLPNVAFNAKINAICRYDSLGTVTREVSRCVEVNNTVNVQPPDQPPSGDEDGGGNEVIEDAATSNEAIVYDTIKDLYQTTRGSSYRRMGHFAVGASADTADFMYVFGGLTGNGDSSTQNLTPRSEKFNLQTQQWEDTTDMQTPRAYGQSVVYGDKIYLIGGIELDALLNQYVVSRKIEVFDIETELWNTTLSPMPEDYGVAFGYAVIAGDYIYVVCGVNDVENSSQPGKLNDKILRYSIVDDEWVEITPSDPLLYQRLAPFGWYRSSPRQIITDTLTITTGEDDALYGVLCIDGFNLLFVGDSVGTDIVLFFRYQINYPKGTTVTNAYMTLNQTSVLGSGTDIEIYLIDLDDTEICADSLTSLTPVTGPYVSLPHSDTIGLYQTSDISVLIQQFIDRPGYTPGNHMVLKFKPTTLATSSGRYFTSYDGNPDLAAKLTISYVNNDLKQVYTYSGSIPKPAEQIEAERNEIVNKQLDQLYSFLLTSQYYNNLSFSEQELFRKERERAIIDSVVVPAFVYPTTGFKFNPGSEVININNELEMDISDTLDDEWRVLPMPRDHGQSVYIPRQDTVYLLGGSNQNRSTTLNRVEMIDLGNDNEYARLTPFNRGRAMFGAVEFSDEIYITGGLTSGHAPGFIEIQVQPSSQYVEARGRESGGLFITLRNDSGEIINDDIRVDVRGHLRIDELDSVLIDFLAARGADRALGGTGAGDAPELPQEGDETDFGRLTSAQNKIIDPNSDQFQFNAARKLNEEIELFQILYSSKEFVINAGVGGVTLLPRSEDPLTDFQKLAEFIKTVLSNTPENPDERFTGDLTREELASLGDVLETVKLPPTIINSGLLRELYTIETKVTILDPVLYGQTVSQFDIDIQNAINSKIEDLLTPPDSNEGEGDDGSGGSGSGGFGGIGDLFGGNVVKKSECFLLQHIADQDVPDQDHGPSDSDTNQPGGVGGFGGSGQCLFCQTVIPTNADIRTQSGTVSSIFYNVVDWIPQIKKRLTESNHTLSEVIEALDVIDHEVPFGSSQLYNAMVEAARATSGESLNLIKKVLYIASDNSQNLSLVTRDAAIEEVNAIDGEKNVPVVYTVFSTSFPVSLAAQLQRSQIGDVEKIVEATRGQATTLIQSGFIDQILNIALGSATGGLGYGVYTRKIDFGELSALTAMTLSYVLPSNTQGFIRFRSSTDGFNFTDFSERFEGSGTFDFADFFAKLMEIEVILTTGFTVDTAEEYDAIATGIPKLLNLTWETSGEREDFMFLNKDDVLTNAQQVAMAFEGDIPTNAIIELGVATSNSHDWRDFQSDARPAVREFGKTFLLERTDDPFSLVPIEPLVTVDGKLYTTNYGPWDPSSNVTLYEVNDEGDDIPVLTGFSMYPRDGQIYFDTKQPPDKRFKIAIVNDDCARVGIRFRNRLFNQGISMEGVGYIYSTNDEKPIALSQVAPRVINVQVSPQTPTAKDTFFALYNYIDLNNNKESGTIISWFKNGTQLLEIQNKTSWNNDDLMIQNKLIPNDKINFQVIPSDGRDFGTPVFSPVVIINAQTPGAEDIRVVPFRNGVINDRYDTSSTFQVQYNFETDDAGVAGVEDGTIITWYVNGQIFKQATFSEFEQDPYIDPKVLAPNEVSQGITAHQIGNQIQVEVTPKTLLIEGDTIRTNTITVENSIARANNVEVTPEQPTTQSTLRISYDLDDLDISDFDTQTDQSEIRWFQSPNGVDFSEVTELLNSKTVAPFYLRGGDQWKAKVTPYDGLDLGSPVESSIVVISP